MSAMQIALVITASIFAVVAAVFFYWYYSNKRNIQAFKDHAKDHTNGSIKNWWYRYKYASIIYFGFAAMIVSIALFASALGM